MQLQRNLFVKANFRVAASFDTVVRAYRAGQREVDLPTAASLCFSRAATHGIDCSQSEAQQPDNICIPLNHPIFAVVTKKNGVVARCEMLLLYATIYNMISAPR